MAIINLTRGYTTEIDEDDLDRVSKFKWSYSGGGYARRTFKSGKKYGSQGLHRFLMGLKNGDKEKIDHIDGNPLNNKKSNLRLCSTSQNGANRKMNKGRRFKGVRKVSKNTWMATVWHNRIDHNAWTRTQESAAIKYNEMALKLFGEFAKLNEL